MGVGRNLGSGWVWEGLWPEDGCGKDSRLRMGVGRILGRGWRSNVLGRDSRHT